MDAVDSAQFCQEIWWTYRGTETRSRYLDAMNEFPLFFRTSIYAHFVGFIIPLYRIFETRTDAINFRTLLKSLEESLPPEKVMGYQTHFEERLKDTWVKISILRNNTYGHKKLAQDNEVIFAQADLSPKNIQDFIKGTRDLLNRISQDVDKRTFAGNLFVTADAIEILDMIEEKRQQRIAETGRDRIAPTTG